MSILTGRQKEIDIANACDFLSHFWVWHEWLKSLFLTFATLEYIQRRELLYNELLICPIGISGHAIAFKLP